MKNLFTLILSTFLFGSVFMYTATPPISYYSAEREPICNSLVTPQILFEAVRDMGISESEFCRCFPCLCCDCNGVKSVKKDNDTCPPDTRITKICCLGTPYEREVSWLCCQSEPPCPSDCCEPCNIRNCPEPYVRGSFIVHITPPSPYQNFEDALILFSQIVQSYGGITCCEEFLEAGTPGFPPC